MPSDMNNLRLLPLANVAPLAGMPDDEGGRKMWMRMSVWPCRVAWNQGLRL